MSDSTEDEMLDGRFKDIWLYCMLEHEVGDLVHGPCLECIARYTVGGPPNGSWNS